MIRFLKDDEKLKSRELYQHAFWEDSEAFLKYYYSVKTAENRILVDEEEGTIVSMANLNPYFVVFCGRKVVLDYIIAVATDSKHRRQGRMRKILEEAFRVMYREKKPFTYLKPANKDYYLPFGFDFISQVFTTNLKDGISLKKVVLNANTDAKETIKQYSDVFGEVYFEKKFSHAEDSDRRSMGFGGGLFDAQILAFQNAWLSSNADMYCERNEKYLHELYTMLATDTGEICLYFTEQNVLAGVHVYWNTKQTETLEFLGDPEYFDMVSTKKADKMARIIHLEEFVQALHLKQNSVKQIETIKFRMKDDWISENNGTYLWHLNREISYIEKLEHEDSLEVFEVDIGDFVAWAFGQKELEGGYLFEDIQRLRIAIINEEV